jgi:hypothetical protein
MGLYRCQVSIARKFTWQLPQGPLFRERFIKIGSIGPISFSILRYTLKYPLRWGPGLKPQSMSVWNPWPQRAKTHGAKAQRRHSYTCYIPQGETSIFPVPLADPLGTIYNSFSAHPSIDSLSRIDPRVAVSVNE